jgi:AMP-binding enzyme C-terminal domain
VVGVPDAKLGQRVAGFVQLADGEPKIALAAIQADLATRLADYKIPERWVVIDRVPRNGPGKLDRNRLLTLLQAPSDAPGAGEQEPALARQVSDRRADPRPRGCRKPDQPRLNRLETSQRS